jgi:Uma2 family endonuclease
MAATETPWTVEMVHALPEDGKRYEVIDGELVVTPSPSFDHQELAFALGRRLAAYLREHPVGHVFMAPLDIVLGVRTLVQPDVFVAALRDGARPRTTEEVGVPRLVIEVASPSSARADRVTKRALYQRSGVAEYWIVDGDARVIERWRPADERPEILTERITWQVSADVPPLEIDLREMWEETVGR